jgi:hypothetical protein
MVETMQARLRLAQAQRQRLLVSLVQIALTEHRDLVPCLGHLLQDYLVLWPRHSRGQSTTIFRVLLVLGNPAHASSSSQRVMPDLVAPVASKRN